MPTSISKAPLNFVSQLLSHSSFSLFIIKCCCLPGGSDGKESVCNVGDLGLIPGSGRSHGEGDGYPLAVFLPGDFHGQRSLVGYSSWGHRVGNDLATNTFLHT